MRTRVKICGFTRAEDVVAAVDCGVDAIGLNFARGPRRISVERGKDLSAYIPPFIARVGLFVNASLAQVLSTCAATGCDTAQLHGDESPEFVAQVARRLRVIKACRVRSAADLQQAQQYPAHALLLDAYVPGAMGGTGTAWDYRLLKNAAFSVPVIIAGGLHAGNVADAISATDAWSVDTASGVEEAPGLKSYDRMQAFMAAVQGYDRAQGCDRARVEG